MPSNGKTPNTALRAWRESAEMTRAALANAINQTPAGTRENLLCDEKRILEWETGRTRWPSPHYQQALRELTGHDAQALGFVPPARRPPPASATQPAVT